MGDFFAEIITPKLINNIWVVIFEKFWDVIKTKVRGKRLKICLSVLSMTSNDDDDQVSMVLEYNALYGQAAILSLDNDLA